MKHWLLFLIFDSLQCLSLQIIEFMRNLQQFILEFANFFLFLMILLFNFWSLFFQILELILELANVLSHFLSIDFILTFKEARILFLALQVFKKTVFSLNKPLYVHKLSFSLFKLIIQTQVLILPMSIYFEIFFNDFRWLNLRYSLAKLLFPCSNIYNKLIGLSYLSL